MMQHITVDGLVIDHVHAKAWSGRNQQKSCYSFKFHEISEGNSIEHSITKTFPEWDNLPCVIFFHLVPYTLYQ